MIKEGASRFLKGEEAYKKLKLAKDLESVNMHTLYTDTQTAQTTVVVDHNLHEMVLKEIIERGGAPSYKEVLKFADSIQSSTLVDWLESL